MISNQPGLYIAVIFPISISFLLTFTGARILSRIAPWFYLEPSPGLHIHHFAWGIFVLAIAGYLAMIFNGPRANYLISLLYGFGLGLAFDEFGMWLRFRDDDPIRWEYDGFIIVIGVFFLILSAKAGIHFIKNRWPFGKKTSGLKDKKG